MAAITYGSHDTIAEKKVAKATANKPGVLSRFWSAVADARMRQAMREIRMHSHLLPAEYELSGNKLTRKNEDQLPFVRGL